MIEKNRFQFLIPSGELEIPVKTYFAKAGVPLVPDIPPEQEQIADRCYKYLSPEFPEVEFILLKPSAIPEVITNPFFDRILGGITGDDLTQEAGLPQGVKVPVSQDPQPQLYLALKAGVSILQLNSFWIASDYPNLAAQKLLPKYPNLSIYPTPGKDEAYQYINDKIVGVFGVKRTGNTIAANRLTVRKTYAACGTNLIEPPNLSNFGIGLLSALKTTLNLC